MQLLVIDRSYRMETLMDELLAAFPEWIGEQILPDVGRPEPLALFSLTGDELRFPDSTDLKAVQAIVDAHDQVPEHPSLLRRRRAREKVAAVKGTKLTALSQAEQRDLLQALVELTEV